MVANVLKYSSIANGTINLGSSKSTSEDEKAAEKKDTKKKSDSESENDRVETDFSDELNEAVEYAHKQSQQLKSMFSSIVQGLKSQAPAAANTVGNTISNVAGAAGEAVAKLSGSDSDMANKLNSKFKGALSGAGALIVSTANKYGLNPALLASIMALETGWGTSSAVNNKNNPGGIMDPASNWMKIKSFGSIQEGIDAMASNLKRNYIDKGLTSISAIGNKYCPVGAANDPNGTNSGWIPSVTTIFNQLSA